MRCPGPGGTVSGVRNGRSPEVEVGGLYLVEFQGRPAVSRDVVDMEAALRGAVARLSAGGTEIRWCGAWLLVDTCRCLCLVQAARASDVVLARDTASLPAVDIEPARSLGPSGPTSWR